MKGKAEAEERGRGALTARRSAPSAEGRPCFILELHDGAAAAAMRAYAVEAKRRGWDPLVVEEAERIAEAFETYAKKNPVYALQNAAMGIGFHPRRG